MWACIFSALDEADVSAVDLAWMPAHALVCDVGKLQLSNGHALTAADRRGNAEADRLAKEAAKTHRFPFDICGQLAKAPASQATSQVDWADHGAVQ